MNHKIYFGLMFLLVFMMSGCSYQKGETTVTINRIDAQEVLTLDSNADIFQYNGVIYQTDIEWVDELHLTKKVQIGEILSKNDKNTEFTDWMSNKLPIGAEIYTAKERKDILLVEFEGEVKKYLAIVEG